MSKDELVKWIEKNKKWIAVGASVLVISFASASILMKRCYAVEVDNEVVALVKSKSLVESAIARIIKSSETASGLNIIIPSKISYREIFAFGKKITPASTIEDKLEDNLKLVAEAYSINVNGNDIAFLKDKNAADTVLTQIKDEYLKNRNVTGQEKIGFLENVKIIRKSADIGSVKDVDVVFKLIMAGTEDVKKYTVKSGDTISEIAEKFKLKQADIQKANPGIDMDKIQIGQVISLSVPKYLINIKTAEKKTYEKAIPYEVKYEETSELYKGETKVKTDGAEGKKSVTAEIIKINGIASDENIVNETVIKQPKNKLVLRGTKKRPSTLAYGTFYKPSRGSITSRFGQRWGKQHTGIDIGIPSGTAIKAADGGKVIFAGRQGNYGKLVIINHENGYTTYYGHCSSLKVKAGQRVARGDIIAASGATGNVTGPHLHFEVRKNGVPQNPLRFVSY